MEPTPVSKRASSKLTTNKDENDFLLPTKCRIINNKKFTFSKKSSPSSIAAANKNSYLVAFQEIGYQIYENGKLVVNCKDQREYMNVIYLESQKAYFIHIDGEGIFKQERGSNELKFWIKKDDRFYGFRKFIRTNEQESIITCEALTTITVIKINKDGSPGTQSSWKLKTAEDFNIIDHRVYGERGDRIALITFRSKQLILLKMNLDKNTLQEKKRYSISNFRTSFYTYANCLIICPLKRILAVSLNDPRQLLLYKLEEDSAVVLVVLAINIPFIYAMNMFGYRGNDLLISCIPFSIKLGSIHTFRYNTVEKSLKEMENLRKPTPLKKCLEMVTIGNTLLALGEDNQLLNIEYV